MGQLIDDLMGRVKDRKEEAGYHPIFLRIVRSKGQFHISHETLQDEQNKCLIHSKTSFIVWLSKQGLTIEKSPIENHYKISKI